MHIIRKHKFYNDLHEKDLPCEDGPVLVDEVQQGGLVKLHLNITRRSRSRTANPVSAKLHRFATKTGVRDSFAQGLEADCHEEVVVSKFERKNLAKVRPIPEMLP